MRRQQSERRVVAPDVKYQSVLVTRLVNTLMLSGKKSLAERIVYRALDQLKERAGVSDVTSALQKAVDNVRPLVEVKSRRVGGATYQVPIEVRGDRAVSLACRWIRHFARARKGLTMQERLAAELYDAYRGEGAAVKKKEETHKMAEANKAFSHYRW